MFAEGVIDSPMNRPERGNGFPAGHQHMHIAPIKYPRSINSLQYGHFSNSYMIAFPFY